MIIHVVLLQPKPETTAEDLAAVMEQARALQEKVPGIVSMQAGVNQNPNNQGYTYGLVMSFDTEEHFKAYFPHPEHRAVGAELRRLSVNLVNFDIRQA